MRSALVAMWICLFGMMMMLMERKMVIINIYNVDELQMYICNIFLIHDWINKLFSEENKFTKTLFETKRWQGPPHMSKVEQYEIVLSYAVSVFIQFIQSWKQRKCIY